MRTSGDCLPERVLRRSRKFPAIRGLQQILFLAVLLSANFAALMIQPAEATKIPQEIRKILQEIFPAGNFRLDGSVELPDHNFLLPLIPSGLNPLKRIKQETLQKFPANSDEPDLLVFENGWAHIKTERKGSSVTVKFPEGVPEALKKRLLSLKLPPDLIVPQGMVLSKSMKSIAGELQIPLAEDVALMKPQFASGPKPSLQEDYKGPGTFALLSFKDGSITLVDALNFSKIAEFPTEGTPSDMAFVGGRLYIPDQAKNRVLMLDPGTRKFLGQIELAAGTRPKGITSCPKSNLIYVTLSGTSELVVIDTANGRIISKSKVPIGPSQIAASSDGVYIALISVTDPQLSVIASYNQRLIGSVKLGGVPTGLALHPIQKLAYVSNRAENTVAIVDISKREIVNTIKTGNTPTGMVLSPGGERLYVAHGRDNTIIIYDTTTLQKLQEVKLPLDVDFPLSIAMGPEGKNLLVSSLQTDTIGVLDTVSLEFKKQVQIGHPTQEVIWVPCGTQ